MSRTRTKKPEANPDSLPSSSEDMGLNEFDQGNEAKPGDIAQSLADSTRLDESGYASQHAPVRSSYANGVDRKPYARPTDPFSTESSIAGENRVQLLKSEGHKAWVIRFAHNPSEDNGPDGETYSKENPHPVLKMLKEEGFRWGFDSGDDKGGWGKRFSNDSYGADHIDARRVLAKAADMIGHELDNGRIPD